ncbi:MAG: Asp23/Gls24 family envelope stress response protein [Coriobacteriia bacterium]|nr:Asp23/Gls24 family envelope stress response protein [Coriobacteriia bacterium]MCL2749401.1 Asp23/Gls24 family envelope stress response protein [Coriobacteriia bacterium]
MTELPDNVPSPVGGTLIVTDNVIADLIGYAALESYGVVGMTAPTFQDGIAKLLPARALHRGVTIQTEEDGISAKLYVVIEYGMSLSTVSNNLADRVRFVLEVYAGLKVKDVTVHVQGIRSTPRGPERSR